MSDNKPTSLKAILDQLVEDVHFANYARDKGITPDYTDAGKKAVAAITALIPEKLVNTNTEENSDWFYGYGFNAAIDTIQQNFTGQTDNERN